MSRRLGVDGRVFQTTIDGTLELVGSARPKPDVEQSALFDEPEPVPTWELEDGTVLVQASMLEDGESS